MVEHYKSVFSTRENSFRGLEDSFKFFFHWENCGSFSLVTPEVKMEKPSDTLKYSYYCLKRPPGTYYFRIDTTKSKNYSTRTI